MKDKDNRLHELLPHRPPLLLLDKCVSVSNQHSQSQVMVTQQSPFFLAPGGIPAWIALEYMGQTAALIAGYQLEQGVIAPHVGFLLGARKFKALVSCFKAGQQLNVSCKELAVVGDSLATFDCEVADASNNTVLAKCKLSVFRKTVDEKSKRHLGE